MKIYTGIGSRETPSATLEHMIRIAVTLAQRGFTLRSGGADGADDAFEQGAQLARAPMEIYLPWAGFNGRTKSPRYPGPEAFDMAAKFHPAWQHCKEGAMKLHARNCYQVLGADLRTPTQFVICWTPRGSGEGGTGQALRIAKAYNIPIFDLAIPAIKEQLSSHICE